MVGLRRALASLAVVFLATLVYLPEGAFAQATIGEGLNFDLVSTHSEIVDVTRGDRLLYVSGPGVKCAGVGETSSLSVVLHLPGKTTELKEILSLDLDPGEVTSVAVHPWSFIALLTMKDDQKPDVLPGKVVAVAGNRVIREIPVGSGPDSVAIAPNGKFAVVACEGATPDPADCANQTAAEDAAGSIQIIDFRLGRGFLTVVAVLTVEEIYSRFLGAHPQRAATAIAIEPEFALVAPDSSYALVTLQEQSAIAVLDLEVVEDLTRHRRGLTPEAIGAAALLDVVFLPHGFIDRRGRIRGTQPDGISISADGSVAFTGNEANTDARHLHSISVLDLRGGPAAIAVAGTHCVFDLDPTLLNGTGLTSCPVAAPGDPYPTAAANLPRLDPEDTAVFDRDGHLIVAVALERAAKDQDRGSVLFLNADGAVDGATPVKIDRKLSGLNSGARPESVESTRDGRFVFCANENDTGSMTRFAVED